MGFINQQNPYEKVDGGAWVWNSSTGMAEFKADAPSTSTVGSGSGSGSSSSSLTYSSGGGGGGGAGLGVNLNQFVTSTGNKGNLSNRLQEQTPDERKGQNPYFAPPTFYYQPPVAPNVNPLKNLQNRVQSQNNKRIAQAMSEYDSLYNTTQATGAQTAQNAADVYASRLTQAGINPLASGVVEAQARLPVLNQLAQISSEKSRVRLDAASKADALAASIADKIASLQSTYTSQLADYNKAVAGYQLDLNKFNAAQALRAHEDDRTYQLQAAQLAATRAATAGTTTGSRGSTATPYNPTWAEKTAMMQAANSALGSPAAAMYWQKLGETASQTNIQDRPYFDLVYA